MHDPSLALWCSLTSVGAKSTACPGLVCSLHPCPLLASFELHGSVEMHGSL